MNTHTHIQRKRRTVQSLMETTDSSFSEDMVSYKERNLHSGARMQLWEKLQSDTSLVVPLNEEMVAKVPPKRSTASISTGAAVGMVSGLRIWPSLPRRVNS